MSAGLAVRSLRPEKAGSETEPAGGGILDGATKVFTTPLFARIALFLANVVGTLFYLEQARLVALLIPDSATRIEFFFSDLTVITIHILD